MTGMIRMIRMISMLSMISPSASVLAPRLRLGELGGLGVGVGLGLGVGLSLASLVWLRAKGPSGGGSRGVLPASDPRDAAVERLAQVLAAGLGLQQESRSHRHRRVELVGALGGRTVALRVEATGIDVSTGISSRLPDGIHLRRRSSSPSPAEPHESPVRAQPGFAVELGTVRGRVPAGLVPALVAACEPRVSSLSLARGRLALAREIDIEELGRTPERVVELIRQLLRCAERLEREFA